MYRSKYKWDNKVSQNKKINSIDRIFLFTRVRDGIRADTITTNEFDSEVYKNILFVESNKYTILSNKSSI